MKPTKKQTLKNSISVIIIAIIATVFCFGTETMLKTIYTLPTGKVDKYTVEATTINLTLDKSENVGYYEVYYKVNGETKWQKTKSNSNTLKVSNLIPNSTYNIKTRQCTNVNISPFHTGDFSRVYNIKTDKMQLETTSIVSHKQTTKSATINFKNILNANNYDIFYKAQDSNDWINAGSTSTTSFTINELTAYTNYQIKIRCTNNTGEFLDSEFSTPLTIQTKKIPLQTPKFTLSSGTDTINVDINNGDKASYFKIMYKLEDSKSWSIIETSYSNSTLRNLEANSSYLIKVKACANKDSKYKSSKTSKSLNINTKLGLLSAPNEIYSKGCFNNVFIDFNAVDHANAYVIYYKGGSIKEWTIYKTITNNNTIVSRLNYNNKYKFKIKALDKNGGYAESSFTNVFTVKTTKWSVNNNISDKFVTLNSSSFYLCSAAGGISVTQGNSGFVLKGQIDYTGNDSYNKSQKVALLYYFPDINKSNYYTFRLTDAGHANGMTTDGKNLYITAYRKYIKNGTYVLENKNKLYCVSIQKLKSLKRENIAVHIDNTKSSKNYKLLPIKMSTGKSFNQNVYQIAYKGNNTFIINYSFGSNYKDNYCFFIEGKISSNKLILDKKSIFAVRNNQNYNVNQDIGYSSNLGLFIVKSYAKSENEIYHNCILWVGKNSNHTQISINGKNYPLYTPNTIKINPNILKNKKGEIIFNKASIYKFTKLELESIDIKNDIFYLTFNCSYYKTKDDYNKKYLFDNDVVISYK